MYDIEVEIINRFNKNISYLTSHHNELAKRVNLLTEFIETQEYTPRYHLEYFEETNTFDIYDSNNDSYLYNKDSKSFDKQALLETDFNKINSFDLLQYDFYNPTCKYFYSEATSIYEKADAEVINNIFEFTKIFKSSTQNKNKIFKTIDKFLFIGTLLGTHIDKIDKKIDSNSYFISEHNLEIFRLSLFVTAYSQLAQTSKLHFSIMDDRDIFVSKFNNYLSNNINANYMIKYYCTNYNIYDYFDRILESISQYSPTKFTYELMLNHLLKKFIQNINRYKILNTKDKFNILDTQPTLLLGAGPSLEKNIKWLMKNQHKYFIISIGAAVNKLVTHNILPNLVITVDAAQYVAKHFDVQHLDKIANIPILASHMTHDKVLNRLEKNNIILFEVMTTIKENSASFLGASVSEIAFQIATLFGAKEIYMLGVDLALNQKTGSSHIEEYENKKVYKVDENSKKLNSFLDEKAFCNKDSTMIVKGNFEDEVITTTTFNKSLYYFNYIIKLELEKNSDLKVYNLSDGAYINNTIPMSVANIDNINHHSNLSMKDIDIFKKLESHATEWFNKKELKTIKESLKLIDSIQTELKFLNTKTILTYDDFLAIRERLFNLTLDRSKKYENLLLYSIFNNYISITEPYIYYHLNNNDDNQGVDLNEIKKIWIYQVNSLCENFKHIIVSANKKSDIYGALHINKDFSFVGFCKNINSDDILDINIYIDGKKIDTIKAEQKNIHKINLLYNISNHSFRYKLPLEYFDNSYEIIFKCGKKKFIHSLSKLDNDTINIMKFDRSLKNFDSTNINIDNKNRLGFLITDEILEDEEFVDFINNITNSFGSIEINAFYLKEENIDLIKSSFSEQIKFINISTVYELLSSISVFVFSLKLLKKYKRYYGAIDNLICNDFSSIYSHPINTEQYNKKFFEIANHENVKNTVLSNLDLFDIKESSLEKYDLREVIHNKKLEGTKIDNFNYNKDMIMYDYIKDMLYHACINIDFRNNLIDFRKLIRENKRIIKK